MEPYVRNPFIYISDHESDFASPEGQKLQEYFKKVFYSQFKKYQALINENTPQENYLLRAQAKDLLGKSTFSEQEQ